MCYEEMDGEAGRLEGQISFGGPVAVTAKHRGTEGAGAAGGVPVADLICQVGISEQTFCRWKKQYGGVQSDQVRELDIKEVLEFL
jgi:hypothetical protein